MALVAEHGIRCHREQFPPSNWRWKHPAAFAHLIEFHRGRRSKRYFHQVLAEKHVALEYLANLAQDALTHPRPIELLDCKYAPD
jgi:hypothetical protein